MVIILLLPDLEQRVSFKLSLIPLLDIISSGERMVIRTDAKVPVQRKSFLASHLLLHSTLRSTNFVFTYR